MPARVVRPVVDLEHDKEGLFLGPALLRGTGAGWGLTKRAFSLSVPSEKREEKG